MVSVIGITLILSRLNATLAYTKGAGYQWHNTTASIRIVWLMLPNQLY